MGASDNLEYSPVPTQEPQPQQPQPYQPNVYVYPQQQPQPHYSQYPGNVVIQPQPIVEPVLVIDTSLTDANLNCCEHCQLKQNAKVQQYSICSPIIYQFLFLFFSVYPYFYLFIAPIIGLIAAYTKKRWVVIIHFITAFLYYSLSLTVLILGTFNTSDGFFYFFLSLMLFIIFAISLKSYAKYIKTLGLLNTYTECTCSLSGISVSTPSSSSSPSPVAQQPQQPIVQPQQPNIIAQPTFQPQVVYDNNQNSYYLIPIQNNNNN